MSLDMRLAAYAPNGARQGILPTPQAVSAAMPFLDVGGLSVAYPKAGPKWSVLNAPCEIAVEVSYDGGDTWTEPNDARYLRLVRKGDTVETPATISYEGPSYVWRLTKARVLPNGLLNADGKRPFLSKTVGAILRTLVLEAQARGALEGMDFTSFSDTTDSSGAAWSQVVTIYYEPGLDYLTILMNLAAQGLCDFTMAGRSLKVYNGDTVMAGASGASLLKGRDLIEAPYTGTLEGLADFAYLAGDNGSSFSRTNPLAAKPWGRWETYISQGGVSDTGTMTVLTDAALDLSAAERVENTYGLSFARAKHLPFRDYGLGKDVLVRTEETVPVSLRCRQITLTRDERGAVAGNVVLNDRFLENEVRLSRRVQGITGGSTADGGSGSRPAPPTDDRLAPKAPTIGSTSSAAYLDDEGKVWAVATINTNAPTLNADNTALTDLAGYEVQYRITGTAAWSAAVADDDTTTNVGGLFPNTSYDFIVKALDLNGNRSAASPIAVLVTANDATVPTRPSAPTVTPYLGQLLISWDGKVDTNGDGTGDAPAPTDMAVVEVKANNWNNNPDDALAFVVDRITSRTGGATVATGLAYGTLYRVWLRMIDRAGNVSPWSVITTGVPAKAAPGDIDSITANQISAGVMSAAITISGRIATALTGARVEINNTGLKAYNASGVNTVAINTDGSATITGTYKTAVSGRRLEISTAALNNNFGEDGQHSLKWTPATLSANQSPAGIMPVADTVAAKSGAALWLQSSAESVSPFGGSTVFIGMGALSLSLTSQSGSQALFSLYTTGTGNVTTNASLAASAISIGQFGQTVDLVGYTTINPTSGGYFIVYDRNNVEGLALRADATSPYLRSETAYARTYTNAANMYITSFGTIGRSTSLERNKVNIDREWAQAVDLDAVKGLTPASFYDRGNAERYADLVATGEGEDAQFPRRILGLIAEDVQALGLTDLLTHDDDGELAGVAYDRLAIALIPWLRDLEGRLDALDATLSPVGSSA